VCEQLAQGRYLTAARPGVELATSQVASQCLNHYTTRPHKTHKRPTTKRVTTLQTETKSLTFPDEISDNISNKCTLINSTFINTKSACYEVSVAFQQVTTVNSKR